MVIAAIALFSTSCEKDEPNPNPDAGKLPIDYSKTKEFEELQNQYGSLNEAIYYSFKDWYLWAENIPTGINYASYSDPNKLVDKMRFSADRWSFLANKVENDNLFEGGSFQGQGLDFWYDLKEYEEEDSIKLFVSLVYKNSPADKAGIYRGMEITKLNGYTWDRLLSDEDLFYDVLGSTTVTYSLRDTLNKESSVTITDGNVKMNTVLHSSVLDAGGKKTGYVVFNSFLGTAEEELNNTFAQFKAQGITELVLDLRYNGGGYVYLAQNLASMIAGDRVDTNNVMAYEKFNDRNKAQNYTLKFAEVAQKLNLTKVVIIGSRFTASASEMVINCLKPYMEVILIGEDTHGKPVGYFPFTYKDVEIYPVSFESFNANNEGRYYNGIKPTYYEYDGVRFPFGDRREYCLSQALSYIETGGPKLSAGNARIGSKKEVKFFYRKGLKEIRGAY